MRLFGMVSPLCIAIVGSRRVARRAGKNDAAIATAVSSSDRHAIRERVHLRRVEEQALDQSAAGPGAKAPDRQTDRGKRQRFANDQRGNHAISRAERLSDAHLARPLRYTVRDDAVHPNRREYERARREHADQRHRQLSRRESTRDQILDARKVTGTLGAAAYQAWIDRRDRLLQSRNGLSSVACPERRTIPTATFPA